MPDKYKRPLPSPDCNYKEWAAFCNDHGANRFLFMSDCESKNKELDALTKKYPELWDIACQKTGEDERLNHYREQWRRRNTQAILGWIVFAIMLFIFFLPVVAKHVGIVDRATIGFSGYVTPEEKEGAPEKFYDNLEGVKR